MSPRGILVAIGITAIVGATATAAVPSSIARARIDPRLAPVLAALPAGMTVPVWVEFADKGLQERDKAALRRDLVTPRSLERRRKVRPENALLDRGDLPLDESYVRAVAASGARVRQRSRWLNRVSIDATRSQIESIAGLGCVRKVEPLVRFRRRSTPPPDETPDTLPPPSATPEHKPNPGLADPLDYGPSYKQLQQIGVTTLHAQGITGQNVLVGHFDNGYRLLAHESLLPVAIVAAHDFVDGDADPAPPIGAPASYGAHGILTLSTIAGYAPGKLLGAAYGASYVLARTENDASETPLEEDNWVAAIEWADSLGIDVASTSLGYLDFDAPFPSWTWQDMNGNTTAITRAADLAVGRGIVVVNSAGNNGFDATHNTLLAPADGDSVIGVGAVDSLGVRASFSSVGPTTDFPPRFKPDIAARGVRVRCARTTGTMDYGTASGTSLSCPLAAGVAALLVGAFPTATPIQIRNAMRSSATQAGSPDNLLGWGILNAPAALAWLNASDAGGPMSASARRISVFPNPFNPVATIRYALSEPSDVVLAIADAGGRRVAQLHRGVEPAGPRACIWEGRDSAGRALPSGVYFVELRATSSGGRVATQHTKAVLLR